MSNVLDITVYQGADFEKTIINEVTVSGVTSKIDLTGYTFAGQAREAFEDADPAFSFTFEVKDQDTNEGEVFWRIAKAVTTAITGLTRDKKYYYDVERTDADSKTTRILQGRLTLKPEATK